MRSIVLWIVVAILMALVGWRLLYLYQPLQKTAAADPESSELFNELLAQKLIQLKTDGTVELPTQDHVLAVQAAGGQNRSEAEWAHAQELIDNLYYRPHGTRVKQQVTLWNHTRRIAAIRDNRPQADDVNQWEVSTSAGQSLDRLGLVPLEFGYVAVAANSTNLPVGFHDWGSASHKSNTVVFSSEFKLRKARNIRVQVVGKPNISKLRQQGIKIRLYERFSPKLPKQCRPAQADAYELVLTVPAGKRTLAIPVSSVANPNPAVDGLALSLKSKGVQKKTPNNPCPAMPARYIAWDTENLKNPDTGMSIGKSKPFQIMTADGVALTRDDDIGTPTDFAVENGLLALVGQDRRDVYSLSGLLSRSTQKEEKNLVLTIDSRWQQAAQEVLKAEIKKRPLKREQRQSLVVVEPNTGKILAAASVPTPPKDVHAWDRNAYSQLFPKQDPYRFTPWQGLTGDNAPGSTFKTVTALALLGASETDANFLSILGGLSLSQVRSRLGMELNTPTWQPPHGVPSVSNAIRSETMQWAAQKQLYSCPSSQRKSGKPGKIGLHVALSQSLNTWFSRTAVLMDAENLKKGAEYTQLVKMSQRLGFGQVYDLFPKNLDLKRRYAKHLPLPEACQEEANQTSLICQDKQYVGSGDVLNAFTGHLDLASTNKAFGSGYSSKLNRLVRASYGQAMTATPLQVAMVAANIASGKLHIPHLVDNLNGEKAEYDASAPLPLKRLSWLRDAMKSVPERGTAKYAFKGQHKCFVYGKTGTADVGAGRGNRKSAWFMGWLSDAQEKPKVAFSCMVTHARGSGGGVCGPLVSELLTKTVALHGVKP